MTQVMMIDSFIGCRNGSSLLNIRAYLVQTSGLNICCIGLVQSGPTLRTIYPYEGSFALFRHNRGGGDTGMQLLHLSDIDRKN
jgi:hypothetical protein